MLSEPESTTGSKSQLRGGRGGGGAERLDEGHRDRPGAGMGPVCLILRPMV